MASPARYPALAFRCLALIIIASPVKGFLPMRDLVAGLTTRFNLSKPGMVNTPGPFLPKSRFIKPVISSNKLATCFRVNPVPVDNECKISDLVAALPADALFSAITTPLL